MVFTPYLTTPTTPAFFLLVVDLEGEGRTFTPKTFVYGRKRPVVRRGGRKRPPQHYFSTVEGANGPHIIISTVEGANDPHTLFGGCNRPHFVESDLFLMGDLFGGLVPTN